MISRNVDGTTYTMDYDPENRLTSISGGTLNARYVFDGDSRRVLSVVGDTRTLYVNEYFEVTMENGAKVDQDLTIENVDICENRYCVFIPLTISDIEVIGMASGNFGTKTFITEMMQTDNADVTWRIYYSPNRFAQGTSPGGGLRVQTFSADSMSYLVQDHLNSTSLTLNTSGGVTGEMVYSAWGETRYSFGATPIDRLYTGQYEAEAGLYFYNARWYDPHLGRFNQADSIIPQAGYPLAWDRYSGMNNNPIMNNDPSGHFGVLIAGAIGGFIGGVTYGYGSQVIINLKKGNMNLGQALTTNISGESTLFFGVVGAVIGTGVGPAVAPLAATLAPMITSAGATATAELTAGATGTVTTVNKGCGGDLCVSELNDFSKKAQIVYRGLAVGEDPTYGLFARAIDAGNSAVSHVTGKINSQWISTSTNLETTLNKWGKYGVVEIDLSRVGSQIVDYSRGIPGMESTMLSNWAIKYQEVMVMNHIPAEAIIRRIFRVE